MSTTLKEARSCPSCGKPLPAGALAGLCPACLLAQGADTDAGDGGRTGRFEPPPLEEVAKLFPQLEILDLLGAGGMGAVYKARQPALDRMVALKILPAAGSGGVNFAERFNREARALARLSHPNIVAVHEFGQVGALSFFIMEFVDGANLRQLEQGSRLAPREALQIIPQICDALQYAHDEGVVHRDIKPENVLIDRKGRVKIADFGLAKILGTDVESMRLTAEGQVMGTPHYMAPEQVERPLAVDHRADIYALGVVFYEMLTGDLPLGKFSPPSRKVQVDVRFDDVVLRALENDPARRYQRAGEVKTQVENIASTPNAASTSGQKSAKEFVRFAGFPLLIKQDNGPKLNWMGIAQAFAVTFGLLTVAFGIVSLATGRSLWDWLGIIGLPSVLVRFAVSAALVLLGVRFAWLAKDRPRATPAESPRTPQGTAILPPQGVSRKAVIGAFWAAAFFLAGFMYFMAHTVTVTVTGDAPPPPPSGRWWQIVLGVTVLPLGVTAPFGATLLGWLAVGDIRRSHGRISGLPLAVFDGLIFPLLIANGLIVWLWGTSVRALAEGQGVSYLSGFWPVVSTVGTIVLCLVTTWGISRRVWRAVAQCTAETTPSPEWWWSTKRGGVVIAILCVLIVGLVAERRSSSGRMHQAITHLAVRDAQTGHLVAKLPGSGTVELLAIGERYGAPNGWWSADGTPLSNEIYEVRGGVDNVMGNRVPKEFLVRTINLPDGASSAGVEADPMSFSGSGGEVFLNGERVAGARQLRMAWDASVRKASVRIGYGLDPWRIIASHDTGHFSRQHRHLTTDPAWTINFHHAPIDTREGVQIALIFGPENRDWTHRVVAVDTNGVEHAYIQANATPIEKLTLWTYKFHKLPLAAVKEFRLQVRPVHWVEFRDVALEPSAPLPPTGPPASTELWSPKVDPGQPIDPGRIRDEANELMRAGDYEAALQRHIWIHNHALEVASGQGGVRLSFYLSDWVELGRRYPRARQAMLEIRDQKTRALEESRGYSDLFADVTAINRELNADALTAALFKKLHGNDPKLAAQCVGYARPALVKSREYDLCLSYIPDVQKEFERLAKGHADEWRRQERNPGPHVATFRASADRRFADNVSLLIQMLRGVGRKEEADAIRAQGINVLGDERLLAATLKTNEDSNVIVESAMVRPEPIPPPGPPIASVQTWTPTSPSGEKIDVSKLLDVARAMIAAQEYEAALQRFLWIHNHGRKHGAEPLGGIYDWIELGRRYPKAREALIELRDAKTYEFEKGQGYSELFSEVWVINRSLQAEDATSRLFARVHEIDPKLATQCIHYARDALVKNKEHQLFFRYIPNAQADFNKSVESREQNIAMFRRNSFMNTPENLRSIDVRFVVGVSQLMEMLKAAGRMTEAEDIRQQAAAVIDAPEFRVSSDTGAKSPK